MPSHGTSPEIRCGDCIEVPIESFAYGGAGVGRWHGRVVFVPETCPGEQVYVRVLAVRARFLEAELVEVRGTASGDRIAPVCRIVTDNGVPVRVPGCVYDHLDYAAEVRAKQNQLQDFLVRQARVPDAAERLTPPTPSPIDRHYRNKIVLHVGVRGSQTLLGYRDDDNRTILDLSACPLACTPINEALRRLRDNRHAISRLMPDDRVSFRWTPAEGVVSWVGQAPTTPRVLHEPTPVGMLEVPTDGFFQVNPHVAERLFQAFGNWVRAERPEAVVDLYCGVGPFALMAASQGVQHVYGVETGRKAIASARRNAEALALHALFACLPAEEGLREAYRDMGSRDPWVVLDPPRDGLDHGMRREILNLRPRGLVYISCAPDKLARDIEILQREGGYFLDHAALFDLFPRTAHFETLAVLRRSDG